MQLDETKLLPLFQKQETLSKEQDEYVKNREIIMNEILRQLHKELKNYPKFWKNVQIDDSDAESMVFEGLLKAIDNYKPSKGKCKFNSFMWTVISQRFHNYLILSKGKKRDHHGMLVPLESVLQPPPDLEENCNKREFAELITKPENENMESKLLYAKMSKEATELQAQILPLILEGQSVSDVAESLKIPRWVVTRELNKLRKKYEKHN